jgi:hypothetical protein
LADPKGHIEASGAKYGPVHRTHLFGETNVVLLGPEARPVVSERPELLDFDEHRPHRKALSVAFKSGP